MQREWTALEVAPEDIALTETWNKTALLAAVKLAADSAKTALDELDALIWIDANPTSFTTHECHRFCTKGFLMVTTFHY